MSCGNHNATSCQDCPQGNGAGWCNGDCKWIPINNQCVAAGPGNQFKTFTYIHFDRGLTCHSKYCDGYNLCI